MNIYFECHLVRSLCCEPNDFIDENCTFVKNSFWIYEGDLECLKEDVPGINIIAQGICPALGDLSQDHLVEGCKEWFAFDVDKNIFLY